MVQPGRPQQPPNEVPTSPNYVHEVPLLASHGHAVVRCRFRPALRSLREQQYLHRFNVCAQKRNSHSVGADSEA